jgi:anthranilate 1,2-dioxygenase small subunit
MIQNETEYQFRVQNLNARYASTIDNDHLEDWPDYFTEACLYRITTKEDFDEGLSLGIIYATTKNMLIDRVTSLRDANIYEAQNYRHILSIPIISSYKSSILKVETNFLVIRTMHDSDSIIFAAGQYLDQIIDVDSDLYFLERTVVTDSRRFDTLLAIPL